MLERLELEELLVQTRGDFTPQDHSERLGVKEPRLLILSDVHLPYHNTSLLADALERAQIRGTDAIVWLGDLMDMPTFSSWGQDDWNTIYERELTAVENLIGLVAGLGIKQYWTAGNHEERFMRRNGWQFGMDRLARMAGLGSLLDREKLVVSDNPTLEYEWKGSKWLLTHPGEYGNSPLVVPGKIADKWQANVIAGHAHHWGMGMSPSGKFTVVESGCMLRPEYIRYLHRRITTHRAWVPGYVGLEFGQAAIYR